MLLEERAVLLGRIGDHTQALHIYIHKLGAESGQRMAEVRPPPRVRELRSIANPMLRVVLGPVPCDPRVLVSCATSFSRKSKTCVVCEWL